MLIIARRSPRSGSARFLALDGLEEVVAQRDVGDEARDDRGDGDDGVDDRRRDRIARELDRTDRDRARGALHFEDIVPERIDVGPAIRVDIVADRLGIEK